MPIRTLIYEDNVLLRDALSSLIDDADECQLVGAFGDCLRANDQTYQLQPDVILMDIDLPGRDGIQAVTSLHREFPSVEVLMLTVFDDDDRVFESIKYLLKKTSPTRIMDAIKEVYEGGAPMSPSIARRVLQQMHRRPGGESDLS